MKKGKWLVWALITVAVFVIARSMFQQLHIFGGGFGPQGLSHQFQGGHFRGGAEFPRMGRHGHMYGFGIVSLLIQAGLFIIGWATWKLAAGNQIRKWIGIVLMVWGAILLLPKMLILPAILVAAYLAYKTSRNGNASSENYVQAEAAGFSSLDSHKLDYLDEWENKIRKEEQ